MLDSMTSSYCDGSSEETSKTETAEGYPEKTCRKALGVFYATCKEKGLDYTQPMPKEKVREHVQAILPFKVLEKIVDKPLRIRGIAMTAGMSRNFNIYTPEELQNFANKLVSAPVYVEHVAVPNACGKVTKTEWDGQNLWYEAEIFEGDVADKIRKGLIQHVSVGADYDVLDVVDGQIPHGLHNAELSLVAVPGIPETNVQIFESLQRAKEQQEICVFCGKNAVEFWLGCCSECFEKLPIAESKRQELRKMKDPNCVAPASVSASQNTPRGIENMKEEDLKKLVEEQVKKALKEQGKPPKVSEAEWDTAYINDLPDSAFAYIAPGGEKDEQGKTVPRTLRNLPYKNAQGNLDADHVRNALARLDQTDISAEGKAEAKKKLCAATKELNIASEVCGLTDQAEALRKELSETKAKLTEAESKLAEAQKTIEQLKPPGGLVKDPPKTMPVEETVKILESLLPSPAVERSTMSMQRECQAIRSEVFKLKERIKSG